jgi:hypothetical protein
MYLVLALTKTEQLVEVAQSNNIKAAEIVAKEIASRFETTTFVRQASELDIEQAEFLEYVTKHTGHWIYQTNPV